MKIWGNNIAALKGKTTQRKTHPVARDYVKVPKELLKLHKEVFLTTDIFFVNKEGVVPRYDSLPFHRCASNVGCYPALVCLGMWTPLK
jgi:hypothetical protein